ncbi:hypothetical protein, partial [uncultured Prochlorococcus sp.]|uniref:hypothetical protein n=1 Tax=uncultured Prochlorococcus sp. TaxID=159733 RepID=UPI00258749BA
QGAIITDTGNTETALTDLINNEKVTVAEFGSSPAANSDIVDTHKNITDTLLASAVSNQIRSIDVLSGDTLKLTSAQFQKLLDAETVAGGVLFAGKILLDTTLSGTYAEVYAQITDYRIAEEENFSAGDYTFTVTDAITVQKANNLKAAGLTLSTSQTYSITDSLTALNTQATSGDSSNALANADGVTINDSVIESANFSKLNTVANTANGPITATVKGTGTALTDGTPLSNLADTDKISFQVQTSATPAQVKTISEYRISASVDDSYPIVFVDEANLTGAYSDFINAGAATDHANYTIVKSETAAVPITLSTFTTASAAMIADLNKLLKEAEGIVTVAIEDDVSNYSLLTSSSARLDTSNDNSKTHVVTVNTGTQAVGSNTIANLNNLAGQSPISTITGTLTGVTASNVDALSADLSSSNSRVSFTMANSGANGTLTVAQATGLLDHTSQTTSGVNVIYTGGITGAIGDYVPSGTTVLTAMQNVITEDSDAALTITDEKLTTESEIRKLNALASASGGVITATVETTGANLLSIGSGGVTLGTAATDQITITATTELTPAQHAQLDGKTASTVTLTGGFSGTLEKFATASDILTALDTAFAVTANRGQKITITGPTNGSTAALGADNIAALNKVATEAKHTGIVQATLSGALADFASLGTSASDGDLISITITDTLDSDDIAAINTLKTKTASPITINRIDATAAQLKTLDTTTSDSVTMNVTGSTNLVEDVLLASTKTDALSKLNITGITDDQGKVAGTSLSSDVTAALTNIKTQISSSSDTDAIDAVYDQVATTGAVALTAATISVNNAVSISGFTVSSNNNAITYSISDSAGTEADIGVATATSAVDTAITKATAVTATGTLNVAQAVEMLGGVTNEVAAAKFTYNIDDTFDNITAANEQSDPNHVEKVAHTNAGSVTLSAGSVANLINSVDSLAAGSHTYTVRDTLDNLSSTTTAKISNLLSKASSIEIADASGNPLAVDADVSANRDKLNKVVEYALDGSTPVKITATVSGTAANLLDSSNGINTSKTRGDVITLTVNTPTGSNVHTVATVKAIDDLTATSTRPFTLNGGITDSIDNMMANNTDAHENLTVAMAATTNAPIALTEFAITSANDLTKINNFFDQLDSGTVVTGTVTDVTGNTGGNGGQYILSTSADTFDPNSSDQITVNLGTATTTDSNFVTELGTLAAKSGVISVTGTITLDSTRAIAVGSNSNITKANGIDVNFVTSNAVSVNTAEGLIGKTDGTADFSQGLSDAFGAFVDSETDASNLSTKMGTIKGKDDNAPVSITTTLTTAAHMKALNALAGNYSGAITATVTSTEAILDDITASNLNTTVNITDDVDIVEYATIADTTSNNVQFDTSGSNTGRIKDALSDLYDAGSSDANRVARLHEAISGDTDVNIEITDTLTSQTDFAKLNTMAGGSYAGSITASFSGTGTVLGVNYSNLSGSGSHADAITYTVSGTATAAQLAAMAANTNVNISDSGLKDSLDNLIALSGETASGKSDFTTSLANTTKPDITVHETVDTDATITITAAGDVTKLNKLIELANAEESKLTMALEDIAGSNILLSNTLTNATGTGSAITINLGTIAADATKLAALNTLAGLASVTEITANVTGIDSTLIAGFGTTMSNVNTDAKFQIDYTTTAAALSLADAVTLAGKTNKANSIDYAAGVTITDGTDLSDGSGNASANFAAVVAKDTDVDLTISNSIDGEADIDGLNTANGNAGTTGTITGAVAATGALVKTITIGRSGRSKAKNDITVQISDASSFTVSQYQALDDVVKTGKTIDFTTNAAKLSDTLSALHTAKDTTVATAVADGAGIVVEVNDGAVTTADNMAKLDAIAAVAGTGGVKASATASASILTNSGTGYSNLSTNDDITFSVVGSADAAQIAILAADTKTFPIGVTVGITDTMANLVEIDSGSAVNKTNFDTLLLRTVGEPLTVTEGSSDTVINITNAAGTDQKKLINKLIASANSESSALTMSIQDDSSGGSANTLLTGDALTGAAAGSAITIDLGTVSATDALLTRIDSLGAQDGITSITADITNINADRVAHLKTLTNIGSDAKYQLTYATSGALTLEQAKDLTTFTNKTTNSIDFAAAVTGATTDFYNGSAFTSDFLTVLGKDANPFVSLTDTINDSTKVAALNALESGYGSPLQPGTTGTIAATVTGAAGTVKAVNVTTQQLTFTVSSGTLNLTEVESIQGTINANTLTLTGAANVEDTLSNAATTKNAALKLLTASDNNAPLTISDSSITSDSDLVLLNQVLGDFSGPVTASVEATAAKIKSELITEKNAAATDVLSYTIASDINVADTKTIVAKTTSSTITLGNSYKLADSIGNLMDGASLTSDAEDAADALIYSGSTTPNVAVDAISAVTTANITSLNGLVSNAKVGNVSSTITDSDGTKILAGTHVLSVGASDAFVVNTGTYAMTTTNRDELIKLGKQAGVTHLTGTITGVTAAHTTELIKAVNDFVSTDVSNLNMTTSEALGVAAAASLATKGNITFTGAASVGITTDTITHLASSSDPYTATDNLKAIVADDPDVNISYTGVALTSGDHVGMINSIFAQNNSGSNTGEITLALNTTASNLANLASGMATNAKALDINITDAIGNDAFATLDSKTSVQLNFTGDGKMSDTLAGFTKTGGAREDGLSAAITQDNDVAITITDSKIEAGTDNANFTALNNVAAGTGGVITATVEGTAKAIADNLGNLAEATDNITFVVTADNNNSKANLDSVAAMTTAATQIDVASIKDSYTNVKSVLDNVKFNHADATVVIDSGAFTTANYDTIVSAGVTTSAIDFSAVTISGTYDQLNALGSVLNGQKISVDDAIDITKLDALIAHGVAIADITFALSDSSTDILAASSTKVAKASTIEVTDSTTVTRLQSIDTAAGSDTTISGGQITYSGVTDVASVLGHASDTDIQAILNGKALTLDGSATAAQYRQALTNAGGGSVAGAVVDGTRADLLQGAGTDLTGATSITYTVQSAGEDLTALTFDEDVTGVDFDLNGKTGVLMTVAQADGATITKTDNGTYFIKDEYATIAAAAAQSGGTATNAAKFKAIFRANEVQVTDYAKTQDFAAIVPVAADGISNTEIATAYNKVDTGVTASLGSVKVTLSDNTTYNDTEAALASNISKIDIASGKTLTIESDAFDNSSNEWSALTTITGLGGTNTLAITDGGATTIDLFSINSLTDIDVVTIADTTGADTINLSPALTEGGNTTINLSSSDGAADKIFFGINESTFTSSSTLEYVTVNNFEVGKDRIGLYYYGFTGDTDNKISGLVGTNKSTGIQGGTTSLTADRTFIEEDSSFSAADISDFDTVSNVKSMIGNSVAQFTPAGSGASRLAYAHYNYDETADVNTAIINAADLTGVNATSDLTNSDSFEVVGVAQLVGVFEGALGNTIGGFNLVRNKAGTLGGA